MSGRPSRHRKIFGFIRSPILPEAVGPGWRKFAEPKTADFWRVQNMSFKHLLTALGDPLLHDAYETITATIQRGMVYQRAVPVLCHGRR